MSLIRAAKEPPGRDELIDLIRRQWNVSYMCAWSYIDEVLRYGDRGIAVRDGLFMTVEAARAWRR